LKIIAVGLLMVAGAYAQKIEVEFDRNAAARSLVWRAIAREDKSDAAKVDGKLDDMVKKSIDKYPPKR
jgi:hypothetical protein